MDEENDSVDKIYKLGFNHGYWLAAEDGKPYLDELLKGLKNKESSYYKALLAGKKHREKQLLIESMNHSEKDRDSQKELD